jgi:hypothetical protein
LIESKSKISFDGCLDLVLSNQNRNYNGELVLFILENGFDKSLLDIPYYFRYYRENFEKEDVLFSFIFGGANIKNFESLNSNLIKEMVEKYWNGTLWNHQSHQYLPSLFQRKIKIFLICVKNFSKKNRVIFPKPLQFLIIQKFVDFQLKYKNDEENDKDENKIIQLEKNKKRKIFDDEQDNY